MNAIPIHTDDPDVQRLVSVLNSLEGQPTPAVNIMEEIGMNFTIKRDTANAWVIVPNTAYVEFFHLMRRVAGVFQGHGFDLRYGGQPFSYAWVTRKRLN